MADVIGNLLWYGDNDEIAKVASSILIVIILIYGRHRLIHECDRLRTFKEIIKYSEIVTNRNSLERNWPLILVWRCECVICLCVGSVGLDFGLESVKRCLSSEIWSRPFHLYALKWSIRFKQEIKCGLSKALLNLLLLFSIPNNPAEITWKTKLTLSMNLIHFHSLNHNSVA